MLAPGVMLHVYGFDGSPAAVEAVRALAGLAGVLDDDGWTYLVFTRPAGDDLRRLGEAVAYEAALPYEAWLDGDAAGPLELGCLTVVPPWCEPPPDAGLVLLVEPSLAFGTGAHPTTRRCLALLDGLAREPGGLGPVVDLGCGTGLLALSALLLGAPSAVGCDPSALAVAIARRNAERNGLAGRATFLRCPARDLAVGADVVLANLPPTALGELEAHGSLEGCRAAVVSGMLESHCRLLVDSPPAALAVHEVHTDGPWRTALLRP